MLETHFTPDAPYDALGNILMQTYDATKGGDQQSSTIHMPTMMQTLAVLNAKPVYGIDDYQGIMLAQDGSYNFYSRLNGAFEFDDDLSAKNLDLLVPQLIELRKLQKGYLAVVHRSLKDIISPKLAKQD